MPKVNNDDTRTTSIDVILVSPLLNLSRFHDCSNVDYCCLLLTIEHLKSGWDQFDTSHVTIIC